MFKVLDFQSILTELSQYLNKPILLQIAFKFIIQTLPKQIIESKMSIASQKIEDQIYCQPQSVQTLDLIAIVKILSQVEKLYKMEPQYKSKKPTSRQLRQFESLFQQRQAVVLSQIDKLNKAHQIQFKLQNDEYQLIFQKVIQTAAQIIRQYNSTTHNKPMILMKHSLERMLIRFQQFLLQKIIQKAFKISKIKKFIDIIFSLLIYGQTKSLPVKHKEKSTTFFKDCQFYMHLPISQAKVSFSMIMIFQILQKHLLLHCQDKMERSLQSVFSEISSFSIKCLINVKCKQTQSLFLHSICDSLGCFEFPIVGQFISQTIGIIEEQFTSKYNKIKELVKNTELNPMDSLNLYIFNFKNLELLMNAFMRNKKYAFNFIQNNTKEYKNQIQIQKKCDYCRQRFAQYLQICTVFGQYKKNSDNQSQFNLILCRVCCSSYEEQNYPSNKKAQISEDWQNYYFNKYKQQLIYSFGFSLLWRQQFSMKYIEEFKILNLVFLADVKGKKQPFKIKKNIYANSMEKSIPNSIPLKLIKGFFYYSANQKQNPFKSQKKIVNRVKLNFNNLQNKLFNAFLGLLSFKNIAISYQWFGVAIKFIQHIRSLYSTLQIQNFFNGMDQFLQTRLKNNISLNNNCPQLKIVKAAFLRIYDDSIEIKLKSLEFLLKIQKHYNSTLMNVNIFTVIKDRFSTMEQISHIITPIFTHVQRIKFNTKLQLEQIISNKHIINICLEIGFQYLRFTKENKSKSNNSQQSVCILGIRKILNEMKSLIEFQDQNLMKNTSPKADRLSYDLFIMGFIQKYQFSRENIKCLYVSANFFEKIVNLTDSEQITEKLASNIRLIFQEMYTSVFAQRRLKNPSIKKSKKSKTSNKQPLRIQSQQSISLNLNRLIKNLIHSEKNSQIKWEILYILLEKNILLGFQAEELNQSPCKVKPLILNIEIRQSINEFLLQIEERIKDEKKQNIDIFLKIHVLLNLTINDKERILRLINWYTRTYEYGLKLWMGLLQRSFNQNKSEYQFNKNSDFISKTLKILIIEVSEFQKFNKLQAISLIDFQKAKPEELKQKQIFKTISFQALKQIECEPSNEYLMIFQKTQAWIRSIIKHCKQFPSQKVLNGLITDSLQMFNNLLKIHPELFVLIYENIDDILLSFPFECIQEYFSDVLELYQQMISTNNSRLLNLSYKGYKQIKKQLLVMQNKQIQQKILHKFYKVTAQFLYQDIISLHDVREVIIYGFMVENIKVNKLVIEILMHFKLNGTDDIILINLGESLDLCHRIISEKEQRKNGQKCFNYFHYFNHMEVLDLVSKQDKQICSSLLHLQNPRQNNQNKPLLPREIKQYKLKTSFVKKIGSILQQFFYKQNPNSLTHLSFLQFHLQIVQSIKQVDIYQFSQLLFCLQKIAKSLSTNLYNFKAQLQGIQTINFQKDIYIKKMGSIIALGQVLYVMICLLNQKKLKYIKRQNDKLIDLGKFTSSSIYMHVNSLLQPYQSGTKMDINQPNGRYHLAPKPRNRQKICYQSLLQQFTNYIDRSYGMKQINSLRQSQEIQFQRYQITMSFIERVEQMNQIVFGLKKARMTKHQQNISVTQENKNMWNKNGNKKNKNKDERSNRDNGQQSDESISEVSQLSIDSDHFRADSEYSQVISIGSSSKDLDDLNSNRSTKDVSNKNTKKTQSKMVVSDKKKTKKPAVKYKGHSVSLPKNIQKLSTIDQNIEDNNVHHEDMQQKRKSKRLLSKQKKMPNLQF